MFIETVGFVSNYLHQLRNQETVEEWPSDRSSLQVIRLDPWGGCEGYSASASTRTLEYKRHFAANAAGRLVIVEYRNQLTFILNEVQLMITLTLGIIIAARAATITLHLSQSETGKK